jgi:hypothetical protein
VFGLFRKKTARPPTPPEEVMIEVAPGSDFSDLSTIELCDQALEEGRIEQFLLIGEEFGGEATGPNVVLGPKGSVTAKARIDDEIVAAIEAGREVNLTANLDYGESASRVPESVRFDLGALGVRILKLWG